MSRHIPRSEDNKRISFPSSWTDTAPPIFGRFFEGWPDFFSSSTPTKEERRQSIIQRPTNPIPRTYEETEESNSSHVPEAHFIVDDIEPNRRNSIHFGNQVNNLLEKDDVQSALHMLQEDVEHIKLTEHDGTNKDISKIYSSIIKSLCDPNIQSLVSGVQQNGENPIYDTMMWRLFTKVIESGYVLERDAHLCVVNALVESDNKTLALQAMYTLPREEWDTECYRVAILLHLMQNPKQIEEAQGLLSDYGKPYLEMVNPLAPTDLPPIRKEMKWMKEHNISEYDSFELWMFYQAALSDTEWGKRKALYEAQREESIEMLEKDKIANKGRRTSIVEEWTKDTFNIETAQQKVDKQSTDNDNTMIYIAMNSRQFEYGWQVYKAMGDSVNDATPCIIMHLCWVAFCQIPLSEVSRRSDWETRAWSVYNRFMCSEFLHPEQPETPGFLHDILDIVANSPEKEARFTKAMTVYNLLVRLYFDSLLCDDLVIEPILCTILSESCRGDVTDRKSICSKAFEMLQRKEEIEALVSVSPPSFPFSMLWGYIILCLRMGDVGHFSHMMERVSQECRNNASIPPASLLAPIQTFHNYYLCHDGSSCCYYFNYMFRNVRTTKHEEFTMIQMDEFGLMAPKVTEEASGRRKSVIAGVPITFVNQVLNKRTNINEPQAPGLAMAVALGAAKGEELTQRMMYFTPNKAKVLIQHCLKVAKSMKSNARE